VENVKDCCDDFDSLVAKIGVKAETSGTRLREFFRDFDKLRSGMVTRAQFRTALNMGKIPIAEKEFTMLVEHYNSDKNTFKWKIFCDDCEASKGNEWSKADDVDPWEAHRVVTSLRTFSMNRKVSVKELFADIDRHNRKVVSKIALRRVLKGINWDVPDSDYTILCTF
jgi:Ca2+-binding EF-hand superfamily protein